MNQQVKPEQETFLNVVAAHDLQLARQKTSIVQINLGALCNQACDHCHQGAGPKRTEVMSKEIMEQILARLDQSPNVTTVDLTGGAPEMNPHFFFLVEELKKRKLEVIDRCNLTVLFEKGQETTAKFLADHKVKIVASLPCYGQRNVDNQRGDGVFIKSIKGLQLLNSLGYGQGGLTLDLVYNPGGAFLPADQAGLEKDYKLRLLEDFEVKFSNLLTITNMPIRRFNSFLKNVEKLEEYQKLLVSNFNPIAAKGVMCRSLVSVGYQGEIYDCDFNQAMDFEKKHASLDEIKNFEMEGDKIAFGDHCFGCTAGAGSSCGGALSGDES